MPEDVAIVSVDGVRMGAYCRPALTTMAWPLPSIVNRCRAMVQAIHGGRTKEEILQMSVELQAGLVVRDSCGQGTVPPGNGNRVDTWQENRSAEAPGGRLISV